MAYIVKVSSMSQHATFLSHLCCFLSLSIALSFTACGGGGSSSASSSSGGGSTPPPSTANEWTWIGGSNSNPGQPGVYGTLGVAAQSNLPGPRFGSVSWTAGSGSLWLFGGLGYYSTLDTGNFNDLWMFSVTSGEWTWESGSDTAIGANGGPPGVYGTQGVAAVNNVPGGRDAAVSWTDGTGNFWLFGGFGVGSSQFGLLNDLWEFTPATKEWTWVGGSTTPYASGTYGTQGIASASNIPGARNDSVSWTDRSGNLWLFGGFGCDAVGDQGDLNDLWEFSPTTKAWTWVSGSNTVNATGSYGALAVASSTNAPYARDSAVSWTDGAGNLWFYGGNFGVGGDSGTLNDLWEFDPSSGEWTWVSGNNPTISGVDAPIVYGSKGVPSPSNTPGGRESSMSWVDDSGNLWLYGGVTTADMDGGNLDDLWMFIPSTGSWEWISGGDATSIAPVYGSLNVPSTQSTPGARMSSAFWVDKNGNFWLFGGLGNPIAPPEVYGILSDLWRYQP